MIWKDIKGYEGIYQVSNVGLVKRLARIINRSNGRILILQEKLLSTRVDKYGYICVSLQKDNKRKSYTIHRLVMQAFSIDMPKETINHKDGNKKNNNIENLEWATPKENIRHAIKHKLRIKRTKRVIRIRNNVATIYKSRNDAAKYNNKTPSQISNYINNRKIPRNKDIYIGIWIDEKNEHEFIEIVNILFPNKD